MQTLDLSGSSKKSDGPLKSLFWPTVDNAWDVDYLGQQGFWICFIIGLISLAFSALTVSEVPSLAGRIAVLTIASLVFFVYFVGGMGVRESSWPAAAIVFVLYVINQLGTGGIPGILAIIIGAVLLSNVRATLLSSKWKPKSDNEDSPTRFEETFRDKLVDQLPPKAWPILKIPFFISASLILVLTIYGLAAVRTRHVRSENATPSAVVEPSDDN